jgi:hypothetical protein
MTGGVEELFRDAPFILASEEERWSAALQATGPFDIYHTAAYHRLSEIDTGRTAFAYFHHVGEHALFYPSLIAPVPSPLTGGRALYDLESAYGYTGPLATTTDRDILDLLWAPFQEWARTHGVIAEVTRFHPLLETQRYTSSCTRSIFNRDTLYFNLTVDEEKTWAGYPSAQQRNIRAARRHGLTLRIGAPEEIGTVFVPIYEQTMSYLGATSRYFFNMAYFAYLEKSLAGQIDLCLIEKGSDVLAAALYLKGPEFYHYHLAGSLPAFRQYRPNNLLFHEAACRARELGYTKLHLGGGRTTAPDDELLRFKASFNTRRAAWHIGETIHDPRAYDDLTREWLRQAGKTERTSPLLLHYRADPAGT